MVVSLCINTHTLHCHLGLLYLYLRELHLNERWNKKWNFTLGASEALWKMLTNVLFWSTKKFLRAKAIGYFAGPRKTEAKLQWQKERGSTQLTAGLANGWEDYVSMALPLTATHEKCFLPLCPLLSLSCLQEWKSRRARDAAQWQNYLLSICQVLGSSPVPRGEKKPDNQTGQSEMFTEPHFIIGQWTERYLWACSSNSSAYSLGLPIIHL